MQARDEDGNIRRDDSDEGDADATAAAIKIQSIYRGAITRASVPLPKAKRHKRDSPVDLWTTPERDSPVDLWGPPPPQRRTPHVIERTSHTRMPRSGNYPQGQPLWATLLSENSIGGGEGGGAADTIPSATSLQTASRKLSRRKSLGLSNDVWRIAAEQSIRAVDSAKIEEQRARAERRASQLQTDIPRQYLAIID